MQPPIVILVGTSHPGNVGAVARCAANFGVEQLRFVAPRCDIKTGEAVARAKHARHLLEDALVVDELEEALEGTALSVGTTARTTLAPNRFLRKTTDVRDWAEDLAKGEWDGQLAIVFGREDSGLTAEEVNQLDELVTVPTADYASLNLAHAVSLLCYEHFRVRETTRITPERTSSPDTLRHLHKAFDALADECEPRAWRREVAKGMWRKILGRSRPGDYEIHNIIGILGNALKRFDHPEFATPNSRRVLAQKGLLVTEKLTVADVEDDGAAPDDSEE
ncbi:MAG: RNA methyltransferase [Thermoplasmatota archaeon]